jgi:phosphodiesterase/alkaline phosphatase D-like protein
VNFHDFKNVLLIFVLSTVLILSGGNIFYADATIYHFTSGVESGDVTSNSAVLWTRVDQDTWIRVYISRSPDVFNTWGFESSAHATVDNDYTAKTTVTGLSANTLYYYRWIAGNQWSDVGQFKTAPLLTDAVDLSFTWSGDTDSSVDNHTGTQIFGSWSPLMAALSEKPDFFIYLGDVIYSDNRGWNGRSHRAPDAENLVDLQNLYKEQKALIRGEFGKTSIYALWDDHEVKSDWAGQTVNPYRYNIGKKAFDEFMPIRDPGTASGPECAGPTQFRVKHWGTNVDLMILDTRSCRSDNAGIACRSDPVPTLPPKARSLLRLGELDPNCLPTINAYNRTMLGATQKEMFKNALLNSTAKFKFVITSVNIQNTYALPYDNWEGYAAERSEILNFIRENQIDNVIFLSTDSHQNLMNEVVMNPVSKIPADRQPIAYEIVTGPIAALTDKQSILGYYFGYPKGTGEAIVGNKTQILTNIGVDCLNLDILSYGSINVTATGNLQIALKDGSGKVVKDARNPLVSCAKSFS